MDIKKVLKLDETTTFESEWNGEKFSFDARTNILTPEWLQMNTDVDEKPENLARMLANTLTNWDITMGDDPFPPTFENLRKVPKNFLWHVISKISESWSGNEQPPEE